MHFIKGRSRPSLDSLASIDFSSTSLRNMTEMHEIYVIIFMFPLICIDIRLNVKILYRCL